MQVSRISGRSLATILMIGAFHAATASAQTIQLPTSGGIEVFQCATVASAVLSCPTSKTGTAIVIAERDYYPYWHPFEFACEDLEEAYSQSECPQSF